jgi:hypothetical protein
MEPRGADDWSGAAREVRRVPNAQIFKRKPMTLVTSL